MSSLLRGYHGHHRWGCLPQNPIEVEHGVDDGLEVGWDRQHEGVLPARLVDGDDVDREANRGERRVAHALIVVDFNCNEVFVFDVFSIAPRLELAE